jgi:protocatechuate 3,4-dioxygenase beta subunit
MRQAMTILLRAGAAIVAIGICAGSAFAQPPARLPGTYISGQVLSGNEPIPLRRARIEVTRGTWSAEPVLTDDQGRFSIDVEGAPPYTVTATKGGYIVATATVRQPDLARPLVFRLLRGAVISGVAANQRGAQAAGTRVVAKRLDPPVDGIPTEYSTTTDDRGEYRLAGLARGRYELAAGFVPQMVIRDGKPVQDLSRGPVVGITVEAGDQVGGVPLTSGEIASQDDVLRALLARETAALGITTRPPAPVPGGGVRGQVLTASRAPVVDAAVRISSINSFRTVRTDARGMFSSDGLSPGRYTLEATANGLSAWNYGQDGIGRAGTPINVADRVVEGLDIVLPRYVAVSGAVVDEHGEPVQGARVQTLQVEFVTDRLVATPIGFERRTDDQGNFRLWGLPPGTYLLAATLDGVVYDARGVRNGYATTYFPGTTIVSTAAPLELRDDATASIAFTPVVLAQLTGTAYDGDAPLVSGTARLLENPRQGSIYVTPRTAAIRSDGNFTFRNVAPGNYVVHVRGDGPGRTGLYSAQAISVGTDRIHLNLKTSYGTGLEGRLLFEGNPEHASCVNTIPSLIIDNCTFRSNGSFSMRALPLDESARPDAQMVLGINGNEFFATNLFGRMSFALSAAPDENWYLKSFTVNGTDVADSGFDFGSRPGNIDNAEIVLSRNGASIAGRRVEMPSNTAGYFVLVFPDSSDRLPPFSRRVKFARSASDGTFRINGLPAGEYLVAAVSRLQGTSSGGEWQNPELLAQLRSRAERVILSEGQRANVTLRLIER